MERKEGLKKREQYHARRNRETAEEENQGWKQEEHATDVERHDVNKAATLAVTNIVAAKKAN